MDVVIEQELAMRKAYTLPTAAHCMQLMYSGLQLLIEPMHAHKS